MIKRILITGARAPVAAHIAGLLIDAGYTVFCGDTPRFPICRGLRGAAGYIRLPAPKQQFTGFADELQRVLQYHEIDWVVPTCEEVFYLAMAWPLLKTRAKLFAPALSTLTVAHSKHRFIQQLKKLKVPCPRTHLLQNNDDLCNLQEHCSELVFKPVWSRFGKYTLLKPHAAQLKHVCPTIMQPWVAQEFVSGTEICVYGFAKQGQLLGATCYLPRYRAGKAASIYFDPVCCPDFVRLLTRYVEATAWEGQIAMDAIWQADGKILPIECNPRATSGVHFFQSSELFAKCFVEGAGAATPSDDRSLMVPAAMWFYGLPKAVKNGRFRRFMRDFSAADDALRASGRSVHLGKQLLSLAEFAVGAIMTGKTLQAASTHDIEWDGPQSSVALPAL